MNAYERHREQCPKCAAVDDMMRDVPDGHRRCPRGVQLLKAVLAVQRPLTPEEVREALREGAKERIEAEKRTGIRGRFR